MALSAGARLGPYEILAPLGAGGMGEVYRARDPKLGRDVALKVLPEGALTDESARRRFRAEADALSRISHPHIAAIYDFDSADGTDFLVMELVSGPSVRDELEDKGALPERTVLRLGAQMARGLQAAHEEEIVHRDLKPSNLQLTPDGLVKILDFGLAHTQPEPTDETAPTISSGGQVAGTLAYMPPEQLRGENADPRIDLYAAGAVLYEMATGRRLHPATNTAELIDAILNTEPPRPRQVNERMSPGLEAVLLKALDKDPELRYQTARDLRVDLERLQLGSSGSVSVPEWSAPFEARSSRGPWLPWILAAVAIAGLILVSWAPWRTSPTTYPLRLNTRLGDGLVFEGVAVNKGPAAVLSPDGKQLAFVAREPGTESAIYVRSMNGLDARRLPGTEGARSPFFSPDGDWIAFFAGGELRKVQVIGGAVVSLAEATNDRGGSWGEDGSIVFTPLSAEGVGIRAVRASGGEVWTLTVPDPEAGETTHRWPQALPGGRVLYTAARTLGRYEDASLVLESFPDGPRRIVHQGGYHGRYVRSGHLAFIHEGTLYGVPFDLERSETTGSPFVVAEQVWSHSLFAGAQFSVSDNGTLAYVAGEDATRSPILWLDRDGTPTSLRDQPANWIDPRFSPGGDRLAMAMSPIGDIFVYDWTRDALTRLTFDPALDRAPLWTPDGRHLVFSSDRGPGGARSLYWRPSDGSGETTLLTESENRQFPSSWHPTGRFLALHEQSLETGWDVRILELERGASGLVPRDLTTFVGTSAQEVQAAFSPDGRLLAYASTESGRYEVYVRPFPGTGGKWQVSTGGGTWPVWSKTRQEIVYQTEAGTIMVAPYTASESSFRSDQPRAWSEIQCQWLGANVGSFDVHPDGERVVVRPAGDGKGEVPDSVVIVTNAFDELRRLQAEGGE